MGRKARLGNRSARTAALKVCHYDDVEGFKWMSDRYNDSRWLWNPYHGKDFKSNRHIHSTRMGEVYRQAARQKRSGRAYGSCNSVNKLIL